MTKENNPLENIVLTKEQIKKVIGNRKKCILDPSEPCTICGACLYCDLDPNKICDNCGKCLDSYNTDDKGYVSIKIDKIIKDENEDQSFAEPTLEELLKQYGLDDDEE